MLQQTQADRVAEKFPAFIASFPDFVSLARAPLRRVLAVWRGLGYNRRALALKRIAARVVAESGGVLPRSPGELRALPGIGKATASSIAAFAFGVPAAFVETNIRAAFIHRFFPGRRAVDDREILPLVQQTLDARDPRGWYNALMDYGAMIKARHGNPARRSVHHRGQPAFAGSDRHLRGRALRALLAGGAAGSGALAVRLGEDAVRMERILAGLQRDGLLKKGRGGFSIA
jgi:A/G-specific adenine glycosylase